MSLEVTCQCGRRFHTKEEYAGKKAKCPGCGNVLLIPAQPLTPEAVYDLPSESPPLQTSPQTLLLTEIKALLESLTSILQSSKTASDAADPSSVRYKVLTQKDKWFTGKFDPEMLENAVNAYADQGWRVRGVATASIPGFGGSRDELIVLMER